MHYCEKNWLQRFRPRFPRYPGRALELHSHTWEGEGKCGGRGIFGHRMNPTTGSTIPNLTRSVFVIGSVQWDVPGVFVYHG